MRIARCVITLLLLAAALPAAAQLKSNCAPPTSAPAWKDLGGATPDYTKVADHVKVAENLRLLVSILENALAELQSGRGRASGGDGVCLCKCGKTAGEWVTFLRDTVSLETQQAVQKTKDRHLAELQAKIASGRAAIFPPGTTFRDEIRVVVANACATLPNGCKAKSTTLAAAYQQAATAAQEELDAMLGAPAELKAIADDIGKLLITAQELLAMVESSDRVARLLDPVNQQKIAQFFKDTTELYGRMEKAVQGLDTLKPEALEGAFRKRLDPIFGNASDLWPALQSAAHGKIETRIDAVVAAAKDLLKTARNGKQLVDSFTAELQSGVLGELQQVEGCYGVTPYAQCTLTGFCKGTEAGNLFGSPDLALPLWVPTDVFKDGKAAAKWALQTVDWLEKARQLLTENGKHSTAKMQELIKLLDNGAKLADDITHSINTFTEGYHLGAYSRTRRDLHHCVGYAGHGVMAEVFSVAGDEFRGGASYLSANLSDKHRAELRSAGFAVFINGRTLPLAPGISLNTQIDGFRLWDRNFLFGNKSIPFNADPVPAETVEKLDVFNLIDCCEPGANPRCVKCPIQVYTPFYELRYGENGQWPRTAAEKDEPITAVFGAGVNLNLQMKTRRWDAPPIPIFPGATVKPWLELDAGVNWDYTANGLRGTLLSKIRQNMKVKPTADIFARDFERLQAPDVSEDVANGARVAPRLGADLVLGLSLASWLTIGVTANLYVGADVTASGAGGVVDFNRALVEILKKSNPPPGDCRAKIETTIRRECSNETFKPKPCDGMTEEEKSRQCPPSPAGALHSTATYDCAAADGGCEEKGYCTDAKGTIVLHDVTREQCEASAATRAGCIATYREHPSEPGSASGSLPRSALSTTLAGAILPLEREDSETARAQFVADQQPTKEQCESLGWCFNWGFDPATNDYSAIFKGVAGSREACPAAEYAPGETIYDARCNVPGEPVEPLPAQFVRFTWVEPSDPSDPAKAGRRFFPYQCVQSSRPVVTGFQGPDCNPIEYGYPSACPPEQDCLCASDLTGGPNPCPDGRKCVRGVCLKPCDSRRACGDPSLTCEGGFCVMKNKVPFAEQVVAELKRAAQPQHVVASYGLDKLIASAVLGVGVRVGMNYRIFRKWRKQSLVDYTHSMPLVEYPFVRHQLGLAAQYQDDCSPGVGQTENLQPSLVKRYGTTATKTPTSALLAWCQPAMEADVQNPAPLPPPETHIQGEVSKVLTFGQEIGVDFWARGQLCAGGRTWDQYFSAFESDPNELWAKLQCTYAGKTLDCRDAKELQSSLVTALGCLDVDTAHPWNVTLSNALQTQAGAFTLDADTFDLRKLFVDPGESLTKENVRTAILALQEKGFSVDKWLAALNHCVGDKTPDGKGGEYDDTKLVMSLKLDELKPCGGACCDDGGCRNVSSQAQCRGTFRPGTTCEEDLCLDLPPEPPDPGCGDDAQCPAGTWCRPTERGNRQCVPYQPPGGGCGFFAPPWGQARCAPGLACMDIDPQVPDLGGRCRRTCTPVPSALVAWWTFDEPAGPVARDLYARFDGRHRNGPVSIEGVVGRALSFDGVNDFVEVPDAPDLNFGTGDLSIALWIRTNASGTQVLLDKRQDIGRLGYHIYLSNGVPGLQLGDGRYRSYSATRRIDDGKWHFVAVTVDRDRSDGMRFSVDGAPAGVADPTRSSGSITGNAPLRFAMRTISGSAWKGALDEPALFSRVLSADEVRRMYEAGAEGMCRCISDRRGLEAFWPAEVTFDGVDDFLDLPSGEHANLGTGDLSIAAWLRTSQTSGTVSIVDKRTGSVGYHLYLWNGRPGLQLADGTVLNHTSTVSIADGNWHFVVVTVDRDRPDGIRFSVDGAAAGVADPTSRRGSLDNPSVLRLGKRTLTNDGWWQGALHDLAIYRRVLAPSEIAALSRTRLCR